MVGGAHSTDRMNAGVYAFISQGGPEVREAEVWRGQVRVPLGSTKVEGGIVFPLAPKSFRNLFSLCCVLRLTPYHPSPDQAAFQASP